MTKIKTLVVLAITSYLLATPLLTNADPKQSDPLQLYRDEIKRAEANASQTLLNQLDPSIQDTNPYTSTPRTKVPPPPPSNSERAFTPPVETQQNVTPNTNTVAPQTNTKNPWLKPNSWESQSKINPWANAPIPSPTAPSTHSSFTPAAPPNIFAPPQPTASPLNKTTNNHTTTY